MVHKEHITLGDLFLSSREKGYSGLPILSVTLNNGVVNRETIDRRTETNIEPDSHLLVKKGYIAYNMMRVWQGALGRVHHKGLVNPAYVVLKPTSLIDTAYAEYLFKSPRLIYLFWAYSYGITKDRLRLYFNDFSKISINIPPISEQRKIAQILSTWDKAISTTESLIANSQQQKKSLMQQLLTGKKRFAGFDDQWKEVKLSQIAIIVMGSSPKSSSYNEIGNGLPLIQGNADIKNRKSYPRFFTSEVTKECSIGDILLSVRAPVGTVAISEHNACIGRGISSLKAKTKYSHEFLYQWLLYFEPKWERLSQGSTFEAVNSNDIKSLHMIIPSIQGGGGEQQKITSVLTSADQEIDTLQQKLTHLKQEKKALMQQLLTGKRRVMV